ncbi:hypothetical protein PTSG_02188 [Salpingoeca rosetta]|uniref:Uncharacterized protein n=1 Tax=Salpingoeca rosetta (strain ATCC 50818 / BSB-021) TaxID=946362 RepID=F2U1G8_SALR5|nr:uncharacterized protein PTSG_02188 [Salpingoeca rosetta]EGD81470.1 hypothetical protein PTSG_02188 [Salpingoeca rosetta]|eukprot:XP_004996674.1 hypothetical protein PTSG_02188 [Salpingoeca rosetta]
MSGLKVFEANDVKVYNLTAGRDVPMWLSERKRRQLLKKDPELKRRVELIQDFDFPTACDAITISPDQQYVLACGTYKPRVRCFELSQMSMKFERHINCEAHKLLMLSEDYTKFAMLLADRYIELHAAGGVHYRTRIPNYGRDLAYFKPTADLLVAGLNNVYALNLAEGRFKEPLSCPRTSFTSLDLNPVNGLLAAGTAQAAVKCFDPRTANTAIASLDVMRGIPPSTQRRIKGIPEITTLQFLRNGLGLAVGTASGQVLVYDIRSTKPMVVKDHNYGLPITYINEHDISDNMMTVDRKGVKFWNKETGKNYLAFEADADINCAAMFPNSGLFFLGGEESKVMSYFIPALGPAPKWCGYLDTVADELDEDEQPVVYDDYKFVTREDLGRLGLTDLIGTGVLRAHMHGFFVDARLYNEAVEALNPFAHEEYRQQRIKEQLEKGTASRLQMEKLRWKLPKVNRLLAKKMMALEGIKAEKMQEEMKEAALGELAQGQASSAAGGDADANTSSATEATAAAAAGKKKSTMSVDDLIDPRFGAIFTDPEFEVDEAAEEYRAWRPNRHLAAEVNRRADGIGAYDDDDDEDSGPEGRGSDDEEEEAALMQDLLGVQPDHDDDDNEDDGDDDGYGGRSRRGRKQRGKAMRTGRDGGPRLQEDQGDVDIRPMQTSAMSAARKEAKSTTFAKLLEATAGAEDDEDMGRRTRRVAGGKVAHISMRKAGKKTGEKSAQQKREEEVERRQGKRGIRSLGLRKPSTVAYWRGRKVRK